jgi:cytoskeleton protein RodZ
MAIDLGHIDTGARLLDASEIGAVLASARRSKEMSLQDLSDTLRIPKNYLKSLENSDFENLPGIAYVPGYIRSYCKATDIDSSALIAAYFSSVDNKDVAPTYEVPGQALVPKFSKSSVAMVAVIIAIIGYTSWFVILRDTPDQVVSVPPVSEQAPQLADAGDATIQNLPNTNSEQTAELDIHTPPIIDDTSSEVAVAGSDLENNQVDDNSPSEIAEAELPSQIPASLEKLENQETQIALSSDSLASDESLQAADIQTAAAVDPKPQSSNPSSAIAREVELSDTLTIRATASSWIEMVNSDGDVITSKLLRTGESIAANLDDKLYLTTGNAGGLMFELMDVPAFRVGKTGEIVRDLPLRADSIISRKFD